MAVGSLIPQYAGTPTYEFGNLGGLKLNQQSPMQRQIGNVQNVYGGLLSAPSFFGDTTAGGQLGQIAGTGSFFQGQPGQQLAQATGAPSFLQGPGAGALGRGMGTGSYFAGGPQQQALGFLTGAVPFAETNPYLQSFMRASAQPLIQQFQEDILPGIRNQFTGAGQYGSSRQGIAEGIAGRGLADAISRQNLALAQQGYTQGIESMFRGLGMGQQAREQALQRQLGAAGMGQAAQEQALQRQFQGLGMGQSAQEQALQRQLQALGMGQADIQQSLGRTAGLIGQAPGVIGLGLMPSEALQQLGGQRQLQSQQAIQDAMQRYNFYQQQPQQQLSQYVANISGVPFSGFGTGAQRDPYFSGGILGDVAAALGSFGEILSFGE